VEHNYLYNYSAAGVPSPVQGIEVGVYAVWWNGTVSLVAQQPISYGKPMIFTF